MNRVVYDGGKSKYEQYKNFQKKIENEFAIEHLQPGAIVLFEDKYYLYTWGLQEHRMAYQEMSQKDIKQAMKDGRIT